MSTAENDKTSWPMGFLVNENVSGPGQDWIEKFSGIPASWVSDCIGRSVGTLGLNTYHNDVGLTVCGRAITVTVRPGDNLLLQKAIDMAGPGDIIVVDGGADRTQALIGGNMRATALRRKITAFIIDGAIRDLVDWAEGGIGIWARAHTHRGPGKEGPGKINVPISCAGMSVMPGDLIVADADGAVAIPVEELSRVWELVQKQREKEDKARKANIAGTADPERYNATLRAKGCPIPLPDQN